MKHFLLLQSASSSQKRVLWFGLILFFVFVADTLMSYVTPLVLRDYFGNLATAGLVMGFSSVVGLAADWLVAQKLPNTTYRTFIKWLLIISIWFPLVFWIFPGSAVGYLLAMTAWDFTTR